MLKFEAMIEVRVTARNVSLSTLDLPAVALHVLVVNEGWIEVC